MDKIKEFVTRWKMLIIVAGIFIFFILLLAMLSSCTKKGGEKTTNYKKIESIMVEATKKYTTDYPYYLPKTDETVKIPVRDLVDKEYMNELNSYVKEGVRCSGEIAITNLDKDYVYIPYLDCGNDYSSVQFYKHLTETEEIKTSKDGLYKINDGYIYRGEDVNNYVSINDNLWRIMGIDKNNYVYLIGEFKASSKSWDNRYNSETKSTDGINNYNISRIKDNLNDILNNEKYIPDNLRVKLIKRNWCIGARSATNTEVNGIEECTTLTDEDSFIGTASVYEYLRVSLDLGCTTISSRECVNYNYLTQFNSSWWTLTPGVENTSKVYSISNTGVAESKANMSKYIRPVIYLNDTVVKDSGTGSKEDPYILK